HPALTFGKSALLFFKDALAVTQAPLALGDFGLFGRELRALLLELSLCLFAPLALCGECLLGGLMIGSRLPQLGEPHLARWRVNNEFDQRGDRISGDVGVLDAHACCPPLASVSSLAFKASTSRIRANAETGRRSCAASRSSLFLVSGSSLTEILLLR